MIGADNLPPWQLLIIVPSIAFLPAVMSSTALSLNVLVSNIAFLANYQAGPFSPRLLWPFLASSVPSAFLGGFVAIPAETYLILLFLALSYLGLRMLAAVGGSRLGAHHLSHASIHCLLAIVLLIAAARFWLVLLG